MSWFRRSRHSSLGTSRWLGLLAVAMLASLIACSKALHAQGSLPIHTGCPETPAPKAYVIFQSNGTSVEAPAHWTPSSPDCALTFETIVDPSATYEVSLKFELPGGTVVDHGPTLPGDELLGADGRILLDVSSFQKMLVAEKRSEDFQVMADLHTALASLAALRVGHTPPTTDSLNALLSPGEMPFTDSKVASQGEVSLRVIDPQTVILVEKSRSGNVYCAVSSTERDTTYGTVDARTPADCSDKSWALEDTISPGDDSVKADLAVAAGLVRSAMKDGAGGPLTVAELSKFSGMTFNDDHVAKIGKISVRDARKDSVLLVEKSSSGTVFCSVVTRTGAGSWGTTDAQKQEQCH